LQVGTFRHYGALKASSQPARIKHIPTVADVLPGYESSYWIGIGAPKNTPIDVVQKLNKEINRAPLLIPRSRRRAITKNS
jgi:tripartite-type tricarboxylate transporter receptor subunit TctC